ncbi:MAG: zinc-binding alcohol dehydrogenase family protein [Acetobacteraceae bacterium]|nr:zinc-binding alcohol dehydrogenase family protein [Acetobacteraceae bacterium]
MRAWRVLDGNRLELQDVPMPEPGPGGAVVRMQAVPMLSYLRQVLDGSLGYDTPPRPFTPGTNGVGVVASVGPGVYHLQPGQRVVLDPRAVADERVAEPAQILIGLTRMPISPTGQADSWTRSLQAAWPDGTCAEAARMPASVLTPLPPALDPVPAERLAAIAKFAVPYGGLLRAGLRAGETVVVNGATGYFGSAGALLAAGLGAARVVAAGRDRAALEDLVKAAGPRLVPVALTGEAARDAAALREAASGAADMALDLVGRAESASATLACLRSLRRGGRLVLMGSVREPLALGVGEMLGNDWHVMGCFMYPADVPARLAALVAAGLLDLSKVRVRSFPLDQIEAAMDAAAALRGLDVTVLTIA